MYAHKPFYLPETADRGTSRLTPAVKRAQPTLTGSSGRFLTGSQGQLRRWEFSTRTHNPVFGSTVSATFGNLAHCRQRHGLCLVFILFLGRSFWLHKMHEYSANSHERRQVLYLLVLASVILMAIIGHLVQIFTSFTSLAIATPSGSAVFFLIFIIFDRCVWHWIWFQRLGLINIPDLRGRWSGQLTTSVDAFAQPIPVTLTVTQTYTRIMLRLDTATSVSRSHMASFEMIDPCRFHLRWEYFAEPKGGASQAKDNFRHFGVTLIRLTAENGHFKVSQEAEYYTEMDRDTSGKISFKFDGP
jgi:hypothetical protein